MRDFIEDAHQHRDDGVGRVQARDKVELPKRFYKTAVIAPIEGGFTVTLDGKPTRTPGRTPVATRAAPMSRVPEIVARLRNAISAGAQAFWVCPLVAESDDTDLAAAEMRVAFLRKALGPSVGLVHGQMPAAQKDPHACCV